MQKNKANPETEYQHHFNNPDNPPLYRSNPYKVKHNPKHSRQYIWSWVWLAIILAGAITGIYIWVNSPG